MFYEKIMLHLVDNNFKQYTLKGNIETCITSYLIFRNGFLKCIANTKMKTC